MARESRPETMTATITEIESGADLEALLSRSEKRPVLIFKHSATCPISFHVQREIERLDAEVNLVVVQHSRAVSNEIESRLGVRHESPQAIIVSGRRAVYDASHYDVSGDEIAEILENEGREG